MMNRARAAGTTEGDDDSHGYDAAGTPLKITRVILCSGHMIDAPGRDPPRFPPALEPNVADALRAVLDDELCTTPADVAISGGACGSDILFAEAALERSVPSHIYLAFDERTFIEKSVAFASKDWLERYHAVVARSETHIAPRELGPLQDQDPYERANLWMLSEAQRIAGDRVEFICVWDGQAGDGPGGTKHMMAAVEQTHGNVHWIDIRSL